MSYIRTPSSAPHGSMTIFVSLLLTTAVGACKLTECRSKRFADCDFTSCEDLQDVQLEARKLSGTLPPQLAKMTKLNILCVGKAPHVNVVCDIFTAEMEQAHLFVLIRGGRK